MVELGCIDIYLETALLSHYLALPREGHLQTVYHIFGYLQDHVWSRIVFDANNAPLTDHSMFQPANWSDIYGDIKEELPPDMQEPLGNVVTTYCFIDANHAGNVVMHRLHTGVLLFVQNAPIIWYSKGQNTVETSLFGSEFVALHIAKNLIVSLHYKLRMFGAPLDGFTGVFCDNQGMVKNTSLPVSTLHKKHNAINYHAVCEAVAMDIIHVGKEDSRTNLADFLTKSTLSAEKWWQLIGQITY